MQKVAAPVPDLLVRIKKKADGSAALSCIRADGTTTWQQQNGQLGAFFPLHDLTHFAVESALGLRDAFYGLVAGGWDLIDFGNAASKGGLPVQAGIAELLVGFFDLERATGILFPASDYNAKIQSYYADRALPVPSFRITDDDVQRIRRARAELFARWNEVAAGEALVLEFIRPSREGVASADTNRGPVA